jgi:TetR/AcrR family transcriptional regulator, transcriptional repressor for nem operon
MSAAGLTHGGFYKHFESRAALVSAAVTRALKDGSALADAIAADPRATFGTVVDGYLSVRHRDRPAAGCAVTALANDVARSDAPTRDAYTRQVERYVALIAALVQDLPPEQRRSSALAALATLVGAVAMARAVNDETLSREILEASARQLKAWIAAGRHP